MSAPLTSAPHAAGPLRIGQIGVGYWGRNLLRAFAGLPEADVVAVCDTRAEALAAASATCPDARAYSSADALLADPRVEAVAIATETPSHARHAEAALRAGKHVFVEKPMAQTTAEAEHLVALADAHHLRLMVGHLLRYHPAFRHVETLAAAGELGEIRYLYATRVNLGIVRAEESAFDSLAPHDLAVARALIPSAPVAVAAHGQAFLRPGVHDVVFATVYYAGGQLAHLHASWLDPHKVRRVTVVGSRRMAVVDDMEPAEKVRVYDKAVEVPGATDGVLPEAGFASFAGAVSVRSGDIVIPRVDAAEPLRLECAEFVASVRQQRAPRTDGHDGLAVVRLLEAARHSLARGGRRVDLDAHAAA
ncbi:MAG: Gfo/Idh/MocA family protein [Rubricoccaceae bacterium]